MCVCARARVHSLAHTWQLDERMAGTIVDTRSKCLSLDHFNWKYASQEPFDFYNCIVPMGCRPWKIRVAVFRGKPAAAESRYPTYRCILGVLVFQNQPNSDMDYRIFNVCTDGNACDCTRGCTDIRKRVSTESLLWDKIPCRTGELNLRQRHDGPRLYQLSYIPNLRYCCSSDTLLGWLGVYPLRTFFFSLKLLKLDYF